MSISDRIGISTHVLPGVSIFEAIDAVAGAGFRAFEIVPADFQAVVGHPAMIRNAGVWPRTFGRDERDRLRDSLRVFDLVTVHSPHLGGIDIASMNPGIREESIRQYREVLQFAIDIGAQVATFHCGKVVQDSGHGWEAQFHRWNIDFAEEAAVRVQNLEIVCGYETAEGDPEVEDILAKVDSKSFGMHVDFANSYAWELYPKFQDPDAAHKELERWITKFQGRIPEIHVHGAFHWWGGILTHQNFQRNNVLDFPRLLKALKKTGYAGPLIFEIQAKDLQTVLADAVYAKDYLVDVWDSV